MDEFIASRVLDRPQDPKERGEELFSGIFQLVCAICTSRASTTADRGRKIREALLIYEEVLLENEYTRSPGDDAFFQAIVWLNQALEVSDTITLVVIQIF